MDILLALRASYKIYMIFWCGSCFCVVNALVWLLVCHSRCISAVVKIGALSKVLQGQILEFQL